MSDDASGPEDEEDLITWKRRMAERAGMGTKADAELEKLSIWENIKPNWRSDEVRTVTYRMVLGTDI